MYAIATSSEFPGLDPDSRLLLPEIESRDYQLALDVAARGIEVYPSGLEARTLGAFACLQLGRGDAGPGNERIQSDRREADGLGPDQSFLAQQLTGKYAPDAPPPPGTRATSEEMGGWIDRWIQQPVLEAVQRVLG